jgi:hypothetical protein
MVQIGVENEFYRIIRHAEPTIDDFRTAREDGLPLVDPKYHREWAEGISVYDNLLYALERARRNRTGLGRFVVAIVVPDDGSVEVAKTMRNRHHYTIYARADSGTGPRRSDPGNFTKRGLGVWTTFLS